MCLRAFVIVPNELHQLPNELHRLHCRVFTAPETATNLGLSTSIRHHGPFRPAEFIRDEETSIHGRYERCGCCI